MRCLQTKIAEDPNTHGSMLCPIILGADKTTASVATGHVEFHPVYMSIGNVHNEMRRSHRDAVVPIAFLSIPKGTYQSPCLPTVTHCLPSYNSR